MVDVAEALADRRQRRRDDGLFQRGEKHRQHDAGHDSANGGMVERARLRVRCDFRGRFIAGYVGAMLTPFSGAISLVMSRIGSAALTWLAPHGFATAPAQSWGARLLPHQALRTTRRENQRRRARFGSFSGQLTM